VTTRLLLAMVFLCGMVATAHAQPQLYAAGPILVDKDATAVDCNIRNSGADIANPATSIRIVDPNNANVANDTTCSSTGPLSGGTSCTVSVQVQTDPTVLGELLTCVALLSTVTVGARVQISGALEVRNQSSVLYVIPLHPVQ
jgi:hypothetical protein